jgi:hypothetical protein
MLGKPFIVGRIDTSAMSVIKKNLAVTDVSFSTQSPF